MLKIFFPERLTRTGFFWRIVALFVVGGAFGFFGAAATTDIWHLGLLHQLMLFFGLPVLLGMGFASARANDIRQKGGDDGMAHLGFGLPLALTFVVAMMDVVPHALQPKLLGTVVVMPLLSLAWVLSWGISAVAFFYLLCVGPRDPRQIPVDVDREYHPLMGVPLTLFSIMLLFYLFAVGVAHYKAPAALAAAEKGHVPTQVDVGLMYSKGIGVKPDMAEGIKWLTRAATRGDARGMMALADGYAEGEGAPHDETKATDWYRKAALQYWPPAQLELGKRYALGKGIKRDYVQAYRWYSTAALAPDCRDDALGLLADIKKLMTPAQIKQAERLSPKLPKPPKL